MLIEKRKSFPINNIREWRFGSGGSSSIIGISKNKKTTYKIFPLFVYSGENTRVIKNLVRKECWIWWVLTKKIVLKERSPHIKPLDKIVYYTDQHDILFKRCPTVLKYMTSENTETKPCSYLYSHIPNKVLGGLYVAESAYIPHSLGQELEKICFLPKEEMKQELDRIVFQVVFTINRIRMEFPDFIHNDLFIRNILCSYEKRGKQNDVWEYNIGKHTFHVPVNGIITYLTDFGRSQLDQQTLEKYGNPTTTILRKNKNQDLFNFFYDLYDGENLGSNSLKQIYRNRFYKEENDIYWKYNKLPFWYKVVSFFGKKKELGPIEAELKEHLQFVDEYFSMFMNTDFITQVSEAWKKNILNKEWFITGDRSIDSKLKIRNNWAYFKQRFPVRKSNNVVRVFR